MQKHFLYQTYRLLSPAQQKRGVWVVLQLSLSSLLDFFSLAFFLPVILMLVDPTAIENHSVLKWFLQITGLDSMTSAGILFTALIFIFIVLKTAVNIVIAKRTATFAYEVCADFASRAVSRYLSMPYLEFTKAQIANEVNVIGNLPLVIANNVIIPAGTFFSEALVALLLLTAVAVYDIKVFAFLLIVMIPAFFVYSARRKMIKSISKQMRNAYSSLFSATLKMVEGLPDIRAFGKEQFFKEKFEEASRSIANTFARDHSSQASVSRYTEVIAAWCICLLIIFTLINHSGKVEILLLLGVYTAASFRIIPSVNRILASIQQIKVHESSVNEFCGIVNQEYVADSMDPVTFNEKLELKEISFGYPGQSATLRNMDLTIRKGEKVAITGKSGAGKTSILLIILHFLRQLKGDVIIDGVPLTERNVSAWRAIIGYVPQNPYILDETVANNIAFGIQQELIDHKKIEQLIRDVDLEKWIMELPEGIHTRIGEKGASISGGQRQRIALARALYHNAQLLLLDEVTNQLDSITQKEVINRILSFDDPNRTVVMITHSPDWLNRFDKVYDLRNGELKIKELVAQAVQG